ncbi:hypothetical protein BD770DRAFT_74248 [Pilaira anomala]|nr:hypothetical protein BD770DRAFT_74248 [Pilaira anomala]
MFQIRFPIIRIMGLQTECSVFRMVGLTVYTLEYCISSFCVLLISYKPGNICDILLSTILPILVSAWINSSSLYTLCKLSYSNTRFASILPAVILIVAATLEALWWRCHWAFVFNNTSFLSSSVILVATAKVFQMRQEYFIF